MPSGPCATGNISPVAGKPQSKFLAWSMKTAPYHPTPLIIGENLYMLFDRGFMSCYEAKTGKIVYDKRRITGGHGGFTSSPWTYGDKNLLPERRRRDLRDSSRP